MPYPDQGHGQFQSSPYCNDTGDVQSQGVMNGYFAPPQIPVQYYHGYSQDPSEWVTPGQGQYFHFQPPPPPNPAPSQPPIPGETNEVDSAFSNGGSYNYQANQTNSNVKSPPPPPPSGSYMPLAPPPMPPTFPWGDSGIPSIKPEGKPSLPFIPVDVCSAQLSLMTENIKQQAEDAKQTEAKELAQLNSLFDPAWPQKLKEMFQPLYCKLCTLTLTSHIVAMDHYKGKKHKKKIDLFMSGWNRGPLGSSVNPIRVTSTTSSSALPISGSNAEPLGGGFSSGFPSYSAPPPIRPKGFGRGSPGFGGGRGNVTSLSLAQKRCAPVDNFDNSSSKRFPLGRPINQMTSPYPKKPKTEGGGPNFGYCGLCQVTLTSQANSDQHYSGKPHKLKVLQSQKNGEFDPETDPRYGIGQKHLLPPPPPPPPPPKLAHLNVPCPVRPRVQRSSQVHPPAPIRHPNRYFSRVLPPANRHIAPLPPIDMTAPVGFRQL